jgi:WD40 repeat protein
MMRAVFTISLAFLFTACQPAPTLTLTASPTTLPSETPVPAITSTQAPPNTQTTVPTISPDILREQAGPICEDAFSALFEADSLRPPFAVLKKETYAAAPAWNVSHPLPHMGSLSAADVQTILCISERRTQTGTYTDGSAAYQLFWDVRAVSFPDGKVIGRNSFTGSPPPKTKEFASGSAEGSFPYKDFAAWIFHQVDHPDFLYFNNAITSIAVSPDGRLAAFGTAIANQIVDKEYQAKIFLFRPSDLQTELGTSAFLNVLDGHRGMVTSLAFSPDGKLLASSGYDLFIKFWDATSGGLLGQTKVADTPNSLDFSPDGSKLAVASNLEIILIDTASRQISESIQETGGDRLVFSPDGSSVYVHSSGSIKIVDPNAKIVTLTFPDPFTLVPTLSVAADGSVIGVTYETPETVEVFAVAPDGAQIITSTIDRTLEGTAGAENIRLASWDPKSGKYVSEVKFSSGLVRAIKYSPGENLLALGNGGELWLWDTTGWQVQEKLAGHIGDIMDLAFTPDGKKLLSAGSDGTIRVWSLDP